MHILNVGYRSTHYYILSDGQPRLLVDAGWPGMVGRMQAECRRLGIQLSDVPYQLATHYHPDHAGHAEDLKRLGVQLIVLDTQVTSIPLLSNIVKPRDNYTPITPSGNIVIGEAESRAFLQGIGIAGEIISTPGHSDDSVTLILDEGIAFTGDLPPLAMAPDDADDPARRSWERIRAAGVTTIYPAHGPVWRM